MNRKFLSVLIFLLSVSFGLQAQVKKAQPKKPAVKKTMGVKKVVKSNPVRVRISTDSGIIIVQLYDSTPLHRDNFVNLVTKGFYDSLLFHRVIPGFMIQGGDPTSKNAQAGVRLGGGGGDMQRIPAEFNKSLQHKRGALCAARDNNPAMASSACQFYIVDGKPIMEEELNYYEQSRGYKYTPEQRNAYKTVGGTAMLDMNYTMHPVILPTVRSAMFV
jgi:cyclophilin family peptidyl-prolyl cis-trans isomerase